MGRRLIVLVILVPLLGVLGVLAGTRLTGLELPTGDESEDGGEGTASGTTEEATGDGGSAGAVAHDGGAASAVDAATPRPRETLRVIGMGWEFLVPAILANGGMEPSTEGSFGEAGLDLHLTTSRNIDRVEAALAQGGDDDAGAHIAILPLPAFIASYERLRALEPQVFFVVAWSRGRDAIFGPNADSLRRPPRRNVVLGGRSGTSETLTSLFMLSHAGVDLDRVRLIENSRHATKHFTAVDRAINGSAGNDGSRVLATTADASQLIPYVAIAPAGFLESDAESVTAWTRAWLAGVTQMQSDVPGAARTVAEIDGAPEPVALLRRVGQLEFVDLNHNARLLGLSGRGAVTLEALFQETWQLWRSVGTLTTPAPAAVPLSTGPVISLVLAGQSPSSSPRVAVDPNFDTDPIFERTLRVDEDELVGELGLLAGVFERSAIEVGFRGSRARAERIINQTCDRYDLPRSRFRPLRGEGRGARIILHAAP